MGSGEEQTHQGFYQRNHDKLRLVITPPAGTRRNNQRKLLFVLDRSGSMQSYWPKVQTAVQYMMEQGTSQEELQFVVYDSVATVMSGHEVLTARVQGCTNFQRAFEQIVQVLNKQAVGSHVDIVFMTDGLNNEGNVTEGMNKLKFFLNTCRRTTCLHTIGFSSSHDRSLLEKIRLMGSSEGVYRFCESEGIDEKFEELFDFLLISRKVTLRLPHSSMPAFTTDCQLSAADEAPRVDIFLSCAQYDPQGQFKDDAEGVATVIVDDVEVTLQRQSLDPFFTVRYVEDMEIASEADLARASEQLYDVNPNKVARELRRSLWEHKQIVQDKLDKYHRLFAEIARGMVQGDGISAQLNSLRHETTFTKARRARAMDQRTARNIDSFLAIQDKLDALPPPNLEPFQHMDVTCGISNVPVHEMMQDSSHDFMVFPLRVCRPELAIDAPTQVVVERFLLGHYTFDSFKDSVRYALSQQSSDKVLGGFSDRQNKLGEGVGIFRGADGEMANACLPLYLHEDHWKRVEIQLRPILGYFFTMDPLGYKGDQLVALYMILGNLLSVYSNTDNRNDHMDWLLADFTKLCTAVLPHVHKYLQSGGYTGRPRSDLVEEFVQSAHGRTKEALPSLLVVVGWNQCTQYRQQDPERFDCAFVEESWRRAFTAMFKGQPRNQADEWIEKLLFLDTSSVDEGQVTTSGDDTACSGTTMKKENKEFAQYAKAKLGMLSKAQNEAVTKQGPPSSADGLQSSSYQRRELVVYEERQEEVDQLVEEILATIASRLEFLSGLYDGALLGKNIPRKRKWLMLIQAVQYSQNATMNQAVNNGNYKNTYDYFAPSTTSPDGEALTADRFLEELHERYELVRQQSWDAICQKKRDYVQAKKMAACNDMAAFAGRLLRFCPIRGGEVFNNLVAILTQGQAHGKTIPLLEEKIRVIMTGKAQFSDKAEAVDVLAEGNSWVHCSLNTAQQLKDALTEDQWMAIEISMHGVSGWAYRPSDIPNRHGHHVSNPNPDLVSSFSGFALGNANTRSGSHT